MNLLSIALLLVTLFATEANGGSVRAEDGNIVFVDDSGFARQLTTSGLDATPTLSPDGKRVAFVRRTPHRPVDTALGSEDAEQIWIVGVDASGARSLVEGRAHKNPKQALAGLNSPVFSPDGRSIYFLSTAWVTSRAVHIVSVGDAEERFVTEGNTLEIVHAGKYKGTLIVNKHKYWLGGGSYDWFWLVSPTGQEIGPVGPEDGNVGRRRIQEPVREVAPQEPSNWGDGRPMHWRRW
ncbi:TolB family protein [Cupriavidus sp. 2TAF22]|uniref:TolB family protein n=1 Tax=unclassified Cupriavidus TaxID=2640874 RepID=UPI003F92BB21